MSQKKRPPRQQQRTPKPVPSRGGVVLGFIHPGEVSAYFHESMMTTVLADITSGRRRIVNVMQEWSSANVSAARNTVTERFLASPVGEWLLWVDSDMQWTPEDFEKVLEVADPVERPIVGGLCFGMMYDRQFPTIYQWVETGEGITTGRVGAYPPDKVLRVAATGAAFILIHRTVLEKVRDRGFSKAFPWFQETEHLGKPVGEDLTFCIRAGMCEIPVHVHTGTDIGHHKSRVLNVGTFLEQTLLDMDSEGVVSGGPDRDQRADDADVDAD